MIKEQDLQEGPPTAFPVQNSHFKSGETLDLYTPSLKDQAVNDETRYCSLICSQVNITSTVTNTHTCGTRSWQIVKHGGHSWCSWSVAMPTPFHTYPLCHFHNYLLSRLKLLLCNRDSPVWFDQCRVESVVKESLFTTRLGKTIPHTLSWYLLHIAYYHGMPVRSRECSTFSQPWPCV